MEGRNYVGCNKERSHESMLKTYTTNEAKGYEYNFCYHKVGRAITLLGAIEKKANITIAILENIPIWKCTKNYFLIQ